MIQLSLWDQKAVATKRCYLQTDKLGKMLHQCWQLLAGMKLREQVLFINDPVLMNARMPSSKWSRVHSTGRPRCQSVIHRRSIVVTRLWWSCNHCHCHSLFAFTDHDAGIDPFLCTTHVKENEMPGVLILGGRDLPKLLVVEETRIKELRVHKKPGIITEGD